MKLYYSTTSPFVRKVLILLHELNLTDKTELILGLTPEALSDHPNPLKKIPALIDGDQVIYDSTVICEYLDNKYAKGKYFVDSNQQDKFQTLTFHALANGMMDSSVLMVYEGLRNLGSASNDYIAKQRGKIESALSFVEKNSSLLNAWHIGVITFAVGWDHLIFRHKDKFDLDKYPKTKQWRASLTKDSIEKTMPYIS